MLCEEFERLQSQFIRIRKEQRKPGVTHEQRRDLQEAESEMIMTIVDHRCVGHDGGHCFGE